MRCAASDFLSDAAVGVTAEQTDATHATATVNQIIVTLQLNITVWLPPKPPQTVVDHEQGHRQISEYYYKNADKIAEKIAAPYIGKKINISGPDLRAALSKAADGIGAEITDEYNRQMSVEPTQALYDKITDHSRNDKPIAKDAVAIAIKQMSARPRSPAPVPPIHSAGQQSLIALWYARGNPSLRFPKYSSMSFRRWQTRVSFRGVIVGDPASRNRPGGEVAARLNPGASAHRRRKTAGGN